MLPRSYRQSDSVHTLRDCSVFGSAGRPAGRQASRRNSSFYAATFLAALASEARGLYTLAHVATPDFKRWIVLSRHAAISSGDRNLARRDMSHIFSTLSLQRFRNPKSIRGHANNRRAARRANSRAATTATLPGKPTQRREPLRHLPSRRSRGICSLRDGSFPAPPRTGTRWHRQRARLKNHHVLDARRVLAALGKWRRPK